MSGVSLIAPRHEHRPSNTREDVHPQTDSPAPAGPPPVDGVLAFRGKYPVPLAFGTSGLRGLVSDITDLEAYLNTRGFLEYLRQIDDAQPGDPVCIAGDLRPSSCGPDRSILRAVERAIQDAGFRVENFGHLPTPALASFALSRRYPSIMVTGSHIPFDRNGIKFNKSSGEILKRDEPGILEAVHQVRQDEYRRPPAQSLFGNDGMFRSGNSAGAPCVHSPARREYIRRYLDFFPGSPLAGMQIVFYQHSAVGRDILVELLIGLGAHVIPLGRSDTFVPVDTEALSTEKLTMLQELVDHARVIHGSIAAIVSTDGDSDRPLVAGVDAAGRVQFLGGDLLGIVVADFLEADVAVVPISASDAVDRWAAGRNTTVIRTRIGSPYVIEAMQQARIRGALRIVGWEANGGFLTATDIERRGRVLTALPTRDATLPIIAALCAAHERGVSLVELFARLPGRFSRAGLIDNFSPETSQALIQRFRPEDPQIREAHFTEAGIILDCWDGRTSADTRPTLTQLNSARSEIERLFTPEAGFDRIIRLNFVDGVRIFFQNGDIAHLRPSGNAPQLRLYAVADSPARAEAIVAAAVREPDGILRQMEAGLTSAPDAKVFVRQIHDNIRLTETLVARGETPELIAIVSGSSAAGEFWQGFLDRTREPFKATTAISFQEDLPTNQAFGLLLLWQRLKPHLRDDRGSLAAFVFGDGTRSTPFTETENAQKPAMTTFAPRGPGAGPPLLSMVELALRCFIPVQQFLRRSGFNGLVVKWGDEVQIPTRDLSGADPLFCDADVVRFVSLREMTGGDARNKDWMGVDSTGRITSFIPRRPLEQMKALADRGLLQRRGGKLYGGINLGSIALSGDFLDCLLEEFSAEVNDATANRRERPALDPEFFTALTTAAIDDSQRRAETWEQAVGESPDVARLSRTFPNLLYRLRRVIRTLEEQRGRKFKMVAMDFEDQYWGDIGQHGKIFEFYTALNDPGRDGQVARAIAGLPETPDAHGNRMINSVVSPQVRIRNSVLIHAAISGTGSIENSVLIGTRAGNVELNHGFDVASTVTDLRVCPRGGTYKIVSPDPVQAGPGERLTTLFLPTLGPQLFRVLEETDLKDKTQTYAVPILGNPLSFHQAHVEMGAVTMTALEQARREAEETVLNLLPALAFDTPVP